MASLIQTGQADRFPTKIFETDVGAVAAGTPNGGWVSGSPANLALSASVNVLFDMGQDWHQFAVVCLNVNPVGPSSGFSNVQAFGSDNITLNTARRLKAKEAVGPSAISASITTAGGAQQFTVRPMGRYMHVSLTNADGVNALGASAKVVIAALVA